MDYKEKYEEKLSKAKTLHNLATETSHDDIRMVLEELFDELKESEEERIIKALIHYFSEQDGILTAINGSVSVRDILAWLEKQGKKIDAIENFDTEFERQISHLVASTINKEYEYTSDFVKWTANALLNYAKHELEKQGEQNIANKVEQKFHKGDWITIDNPCEIMAIDGNYIVQYCDDEKTREISKKFCESQFHLWTIRDAKDGDVLTTKDIVFIFKHMDKTGLSLCKSYCEVIGNSKLGLGFDFSINDVHPATKEQRDLLFQKMKEAGYEWDAEKKELKKIEELNPNENTCKISDCDTKVDMTEYNNGYECGKQRVLKYPEEYGLCKKPTWSEEDEKMLKSVISSIRISRSSCEEDDDVRDLFDNEIDWLKSLKERYIWKPSDEQIEAFEHFVRSVGESGYASPYSNNTRLLYSLLEQLKKLREE